jgi:hypothetical protein
MIYFRDTPTGSVFGYEAEQQDLVNKAEADPNMENITGSWPPPIDPQHVISVEVRAKRNALLARSDWTQVVDAPVNSAVWATYRQVLRDIPQQEGFPHSVVWPEKPAG